MGKCYPGRARVHVGNGTADQVDSEVSGIGQQGQLTGAGGHWGLSLGWQESQHQPCLS